MTKKLGDKKPSRLRQNTQENQLEEKVDPWEHSVRPACTTGWLPYSGGPD